jgi:hypothetical protein
MEGVDMHDRLFMDVILVSHDCPKDFTQPLPTMSLEPGTNIYDSTSYLSFVQTAHLTVCKWMSHLANNENAETAHYT